MERLHTWVRYGKQRGSTEIAETENVPVAIF